MLSPRLQAHLALISASLVLIASLSVLIAGRESLRGRHAPEKNEISAKGEQQVVFGGPTATFAP